MSASTHRPAWQLPAWVQNRQCSKRPVKQLSSDVYSHHQDRLGVDIELVGVTSSSKMFVEPAGLSLATWEADFQAKAAPADLSSFSEQIAAMDSDAVIFDCTASDAPCDFYSTWMEAGVHVITPNKKLHSGPLDRYEAVRKLQADGAAHYFYEVCFVVRRRTCRGLRPLQAAAAPPSDRSCSLPL